VFSKHEFFILIFLADLFAVLIDAVLKLFLLRSKLNN